MEWRITKTNSGYHTEYGGYVEEGQKAGFRIGFIMPGFNVQESARFDTEQEVKNYIERKKNNT
mgnify:FL=1